MVAKHILHSFLCGCLGCLGSGPYFICTLAYLCDLLLTILIKSFETIVILLPIRSSPAGTDETGTDAISRLGEISKSFFVPHSQTFSPFFLRS